jgi:cobalt-zinc-cadmium efflux system outer membrane protein
MKYPMIKPIILSVLLPVAFVGCTSTNPKTAFNDVDKTVTARTGQQLRWAQDDSQRKEITTTVEALLQTNLTAPAAVTIALLNNRSLQAEFEAVGISQADLAQAARLKNIEIVGSWRFPNRPPSALNAEYSAAADFLDLLTLPTRKKIARRELEQTKLRVADSVLRLAADAQTAFYTVQASGDLARRLGVIEEVNEATADLAQRQYDAGNINDLELRNQQASAAQVRLDFMLAKAQTRADRERLNRVLGLSGGQTNWKVADELPGLPATESPLENLETLAINQRLDLAAVRSEAESVAAALRLKQKTRFIPGVTVGVSTERDTDGQRVTGPSLGLEIPLFDQGQPAVARLAAQYRQAQNKLAAMEVNTRSEVRQAQDGMLAAREAAEHYAKTLLPQRQRILKETLLHYNAMQKSSYELLAAKEREQIAERGYVQALRDYWIARAELEHAVGGRLSGDASPMPAPTKTDSKTSEEHHQHEKH